MRTPRLRPARALFAAAIVLLGLGAVRAATDPPVSSPAAPGPGVATAERDEPGVPIQLHLGRASTIPFDSPSGLIILTARINGRSQVRLLLDTGDPSGFTLDARKARAVGLPLTDRTPTRATGMVGSERFDLYRARVESFLLGGLSARDFSIWTAPDAALLAKMTGARVDGFVGVDLLRGLHVTLSYPTRQITFAPPAAPPQGQAAPQPPGVPLRLEGNRIVVDVLLDGREARPMLIDTAAGATFIAQSDEALTRPSPTGAATQIVDSSGTAISVPIRILPSLAFGGVEVRDVPVVPYDFEELRRALFASTSHDVSGILGSDVLSRCVVVLDFPARRLRVTRCGT